MDFAAELSETEREILTAARQVFAAQGYHQAVVGEIAEKAGVGKGTVYRHFDNKAGLFASLIDQISRAMSQRIEAAVERVSSPRRQLEIIFEAHLDLYEEARPMVEILVNEGLVPTGIREHNLVTKWDSYLEVVREVFAAGQQQGELVGPPPEKSARLFVSSIWGLLRSAIIFQLENLREEFAEEFMEVFLNGVNKKDDGN